MTRFEFLPHTSEQAVAAYGKDLPETFASAAMGMFSVIADLGGVRETEIREVEVSAEDVESLLIAWLNELIFIFDVEHLLLKRFDFRQLDETYLKAAVHGERYDPSRHGPVKGVKAATYHQVQISRVDGFRAQFILDV